MCRGSRLEMYFSGGVLCRRVGSSVYMERFLVRMELCMEACVQGVCQIYLLEGVGRRVSVVGSKLGMCGIEGATHSQGVCGEEETCVKVCVGCVCWKKWVENVC